MMRAGVGCAGSWRYSIEASADVKPGTCEIEAPFDARPFGAVLKAKKEAIVE